MLAVAWTDTHLGIQSLDRRMGNMLNDFAVQLYEDIHPDVAICLGDVFHTKKPAADVVEFATAWFSSVASFVPNVLLIPGNHDIDGMTGSTAIDYLDDLASNIQIFYEPTQYMDMLFVPYKRALDNKMRNLIKAHPQVFLHQGYSKAPLYGSRLYGEKPDAVYEDEIEGKTLALIGHIHVPMCDPENNLHILGSPYQTRYTEPALQRGFACWTVENPSDFQIIPFRSNFYLEKINLTVQPSASLVNDVIQSLPSPEENHYYQVMVTVEGKARPNQLEAIRKSITEIYKGCLDGSGIMTVLEAKERTFFQQMKVASSVKEKDTAPTEMLSVYMQGMKQSYFKANPEIYTGVLDEFTDIVKSISEIGKDDK